MAKKESKKFSFLRLPILFLLALVAIAIWWLWETKTSVQDIFLSYVDKGEITTLESRYTPEQIMRAHQIDLIGSNTGRTYQDPIYKYYPYLLLDVKYTEDKKSREGLLLWSLTDGEIVLNTDHWETTHGFTDCLDCQATREDFKVLQALAKHQGILSLDNLQQELHVERDVLENWLESAKEKHLIVQIGNTIQLHFENPKILVLPQTQIKQHLVSKPISDGSRVSKTYSRSQIVDIAKAAFGNDFKIRNEQEVFLPVYSISVLNPDGSVHTSDWNAITGQPLKLRQRSLTAK